MTKIKNFFKRIFAFIKKGVKKIMNGIKNGYEYVRDELRDYSNKTIEETIERHIVNGMSEEEARAIVLNNKTKGDNLLAIGILNFIVCVLGRFIIIRR